MRRTVYVAFMGLKRDAYRVLEMEPVGSKQFERHRHGWEGNIKMEYEGMGWEVLD
jgi:hypothetical protein